MYLLKKFKVIKQNKGLTLIEIILALGILGIIVISIASIFTNAFMYMMQAKEKFEALNLAQEYMETIKSEDLSEIFQAYDNKVFKVGNYTIDTDLQGEEKDARAIKIRIKVKNDEKEMVKLESYRKKR